MSWQSGRGPGRRGRRARVGRRVEQGRLGVGKVLQRMKFACCELGGGGVWGGLRPAQLALSTQLAAGLAPQMALSTQLAAGPAREVKQRKFAGVTVFFASRHGSSRLDGPPDLLPVSGQGHLGPPPTNCQPVAGGRSVARVVKKSAI